MGLLGKSKTPVQNAPLYPNCNKILPPTPVVQHDDGVCVKVKLLLLLTSCFLLEMQICKILFSKK